MFFILPLLWWLFGLTPVNGGVVLDPALFLAPSPPLTPSRYALTAVEMWTETLADRVERVADDVSVLPLKRTKLTTATTPKTTEEPSQQTTEEGLTGEIEPALIESQFPYKKYTKEPIDLTGVTIESAESLPKKYNTDPYTNDARASYYGLGGIHIPLSFSISGSYGRFGGRPGLVASNYATAETNDSLMGLFGYGNNAKPALAGGGYNYNSMSAVNPLLRVYGSGSGPSWSGWGNGKWGHYGKG